MTEHHLNWLHGIRKVLRELSVEFAWCPVQVSDPPSRRVVYLADIIELAQLAVLPDEQAAAAPDENSFTGHYGEWTMLGELPDGVVFEKETGERWAKSKLGSLVRLTDVFQSSLELVKVRQIHLPEPPQPQPEPPNLEEALRWLEYGANGSFEEGWRINLTGHQMNYVRDALALAHDALKARKEGNKP